MSFLAGKKTYILAALGAVALFGQMVGWWTIPEQLWALLGISGAVTLRLGISKGK